MTQKKLHSRHFNRKNKQKAFNLDKIQDGFDLVGEPKASMKFDDVYLSLEQILEKTHDDLSSIVDHEEPWISSNGQVIITSHPYITGGKPTKSHFERFKQRISNLIKETMWEELVDIFPPNMGWYTPKTALVVLRIPLEFYQE